MSNAIFPSSLSGYAWESKKKPTFNNITYAPATGRSVRLSLYDQPIYEFNLINVWMSKADKDTLMAFFVARKGSFDSFLYHDEDSVTTNQPFAFGYGFNVAFQLTKVTNEAIEIVNNAANVQIYVNSVLQTITTHYTIDSNGLVTFVTPPATNAVISWTGLAYYRCVFIDDSLEYNQFANQLYDCSEILFKGSLANKL